MKTGALFSPIVVSEGLDGTLYQSDAGQYRLRDGSRRVGRGRRSGRPRRCGGACAARILSAISAIMSPELLLRLLLAIWIVFPIAVVGTVTVVGETPQLKVNFDKYQY
ncbi:MAG: hypothetical protein WCD69_28495 [Xanthobacteraceae bacterium]